jgi:hypothetical protein
MTWHRVWLIKCNGENCGAGHVTENPNIDPEGWVTNGTEHLCPDCKERIEQPEPTE